MLVYPYVNVNNVLPLIINTIDCSLARILNMCKIDVTAMSTIYVCYISH